MYDIIFVRNKDRISGERPAAVTTADSMTSLSESLQEVGRSIILQTRSPTKIGTWNVRTMFEAGRSANISEEMRSYGLDILGLCETRWTGSGETRLNSGETLLYSGHREKTAAHTQGVGIRLSKQAMKALIG